MTFALSVPTRFQSHKTLISFTESSQYSQCPQHIPEPLTSSSSPSSSQQQTVPPQGFIRFLPVPTVPLTLGAFQSPSGDVEFPLVRHKHDLFSTSIICILHQLLELGNRARPREPPGPEKSIDPLSQLGAKVLGLVLDRDQPHCLQ